MGFSKRDLAKDFQLSPRTVYRTLKAAQLSTAKLSYSDVELGIFEIARSMLEQGCTYEQVAQFFKDRQQIRQVFYED